jgi:uncharacterized phage protein (TIGR01671 family)
MREIKFRAWDKVNKRIIYFDGDTLLSNVTNPPEKNDYIPMQYTWVKDKNGKEIYEGDILEFKGWGFCGAIDGYLGQIIHVTLPGFYLKKYELEGQCAFGFENNVEIIGNGYENPELLEGKS